MPSATRRAGTAEAARAMVMRRSSCSNPMRQREREDVSEPSMCVPQVRVVHPFPSRGGGSRIGRILGPCGSSSSAPAATSAAASSPLLRDRGHDLVLMSRDARPLAARFPDTRVVAADLLEPSHPRPGARGRRGRLLPRPLDGCRRGGLRRAGPAGGAHLRPGGGARRRVADRLPRRPGRRRGRPLAPPGQPPRDRRGAGGPRRPGHRVPGGRDHRLRAARRSRSCATSPSGCRS